MSFLVDTNILSELAKKIPNAGVQEWARGISKIFISMVTLEELYFGLNWKPRPKVSTWIEKFLEEHCQLLSITELIAKRSGELRGQLRATGKERTQADMLIAASAAIHGLTLVTRNESDFEGCGIAVLNPFKNHHSCPAGSYNET